MNNDTKTTNKPSKFSNRLGILILALIVIWISSMIFGHNLLEAGTVAPNWSLEIADGSGEHIKLQELRGKVVVMSFWSTT